MLKPPRCADLGGFVVPAFRTTTKQIGVVMFDNIQCNGEDWVCFLDEAYRGNWTAYAGDGTHSVTGADEYWSNV